MCCACAVDATCLVLPSKQDPVQSIAAVCYSMARLLVGLSALQLTKGVRSRKVLARRWLVMVEYRSKFLCQLLQIGNG